MKYWKGIIGTPKEGMCGTMNNNGFVPDSIGSNLLEYNQYIQSLPEPEPQPKSDIDKLIEHAKKEKWIN